MLMTFCAKKKPYICQVQDMHSVVEVVHHEHLANNCRYSHCTLAIGIHWSSLNWMVYSHPLGGRIDYLDHQFNSESVRGIPFTH